MTKSTFRNYYCDVVEKVVNLELNWESDNKENSTTGLVVGDCSYSKTCGMVDENGAYDWKKCPVYGKKESFL